MPGIKIPFNHALPFVGTNFKNSSNILSQWRTWMKRRINFWLKFDIRIRCPSKQFLNRSTYLDTRIKWIWRANICRRGLRLWWHLGCFVPCLKRTKAKVLLKQDAAFYRVLTRKWSQTIDKYIIVHKKGRIGERNEGLVTRLNHELAAW